MSVGLVLKLPGAEHEPFKCQSYRIQHVTGFDLVFFFPEVSLIRKLHEERIVSVPEHTSTYYTQTAG